MIKINNIEIKQNHFPDNSLLIKLPPIEDKVHIIWKYESDAELFTLICARRHYATLPATLSISYIPHARMDRVKAAEDVFTLKYFCEVINSLNFETVYVLDAHSNVSLSLLNNVFQMDVTEIIQEAINLHDNGNLTLFFPDEGAMKRYADSFTSYPIAFGMKRRDWATGQILGLDIMQSENIKGKDVLIIDDICSRGGTFYHSAKALLAAGAKSVSLYITHCENTILEGEIFSSGLIQKVYTTDSLIHKDELNYKVIYV